MIGTAGASLGKWHRKVDANSTSAVFTVNQRGAGNILDCQAGGVSKFTVSAAGGLTLTGGISLTVAGVALDVQNTTDAASNQVAIFKGGNRGTPADSDEGYLSFYLDDSTGTQAEFARMTWIATDVTSTTKDAKISFAVSSNRNAGALTTAFEITSSAANVVSTTVTAPMIYAEATAPAGTACYLVRDNSGDMTINALTGHGVNIAIAGTDEIQYTTGAMSFRQTSTISTSTGALTIDGDDGIVLQTTGSGSVQVKEVLVLGIGEAATGAKTGNTLRGPDHPGGTDTDQAGADITIAAGLGTGDGDVGTIIFQLPEVVGAGTTIQTRATVLTMDMVASTTEMSFTFTPNTTIASSGTLTLGAITLGGAIAGGDQAFTNVGDMTFTAGSILTTIDGAGTTLLLKAGGLSGTTFITLTSQSGGTDTMILGKAFFFDAGGEYIESNGTNLTIAGNVIFPSTLYLYDAGGESLSSDGSILTIAGAITFSGSSIITADSATVEVGAAGVIKSGATNTDTMILAANDTTFITFLTAATDVCTLDGVTLKGTILADGTVTLPAMTLGGAVAGGDQAFTGVGDMTFTAGSILAAGATNADTLLIKAGGLTGTTFITLTSNATDTCDLDTSVTIGSAYITRIGGTDVTVADGGTGVSTLALNGILYGNGASAVGVTAIGAEGQILRAGASPFVPAWTTATFPATTTVNQILYSSATNVVSGLATGNSMVLVTSAGGVPSLSATLPAVTLGGTVTLNGQTFSGAALFSAGIVTGGGTPIGVKQNQIAGAFVSDGSDSYVIKTVFDGLLTGAVGDTSFLACTYFANSIATQTATEDIGWIAQVNIAEPTITKNLTGNITVAATLRIQSAPTEGVTNAALLVVSGSTILQQTIIGTGEGGVVAGTDGILRGINMISGAGDDDVAGPDLYIKGSLGRGAGDVGQIIFQTAQVAAADTIQTYETILTLDEDLATFAKPVSFAAITLGGAVSGGGQSISALLNITGMTGYHELTEMAAPGAGAANTARIYAIVGGDTLTDVAAVFQDGTVDIFAQEATPPDSPIFEFPDNTEFKSVMRKPDRKTVQFVAQFPDGREFVMREIQYPTARWN